MSVSEGHRSVGRALEALELAVAADGGLALGDIATQIGAPKSSLHPLLRALVHRGYLSYEDNRYHVGPSVIALAAASQPSLVTLARPLREELRERFDETVMLGSMVGDTLVYLHVEESHQAVRYSPPRVRPPTENPSSIGKLYLAQLNDPAVEAYLETEAPADRREVLRQEIDEARRTGIAYNHGETFGDLTAVASRITVGRSLLACLAIGGPSTRLDPQSEKIAAALLEASGKIASDLR